MTRHYYGVLGVSPDADGESLRRAYRALAGRWHPDRQAERSGPGEASAGEAERRFKAIAEAWTTLSEPTTRAAFDAELRASAARAAPEGIWVDRVFGVRERAPEAGRNRRYRVSVAVADVIRGAERVVELPRWETCPRCDGARWAAEGPPIVCPTCAGRTEVVTRPVVRAEWSACRSCGGRGWVPEVACGTCKGEGVTGGVERLVVPIPAGTEDGQALRVKGRGEPGEPPGDLMVEVRVVPDRRFVVAGRDVRHTRVVPFWKALTGGPLEVATAWGPALVHVPAGSRDGDELRLVGWGVGRRGDQLVRLELEWPSGLDAASRAALEAWGHAAPGGAFPRSEDADREVRLERH